MKNEYKIGLLVLTLLIGFYSGILAVKVGPVELGSAIDSGARSAVATSTDFLATEFVLNLVGTSTCTARVITTGAKGVGLTFGDEQGDKLTGFNGHFQAASTTVVYGSENYGCGLIKVRADGASSLLHVTDYR